ncbi:hypothetical protein N7486_001523 [Penicillium sp. IBT 16267x]|nr:hypothetical protein N7486_001523 [Penicillium sp. IBT 16267x]
MRGFAMAKEFKLNNLIAYNCVKWINLASSKRQHRKLSQDAVITNPDFTGFDVENMLKAKHVLKKDFCKREFQRFKQDHFAAVALQPPSKKSAADAKFADVPGWGSGSKVQAGHFLTLNVIFQYVDIKDLCGGPLGIPKRILNAKLGFASACENAEEEEESMV